MRKLVEPQIIPTMAQGTAGRSVKHESAHKHVSGQAQFTDDIPMPAGTLHAYMGFSDIAKGKVLSMDLSQVKQAKGVKAVITAEDIPGHKDIGPIFAGDPLLTLGDIEGYGQVLFAVAATSYDLARKAVKQAKVEYHEETPDVTIQQGLVNNKFVRPSHIQQRGNPEKAITDAPHQLSGELEVGGQEHMYLEGQVALVMPTEDLGYHVYSSNQNPTEVQKLVAEVMDIPLSRVTADVRRMGGGFGGKETNANAWACIAAVLAAKTNKAVKCRLARADDMLTTGKRHHFYNKYRVGFDDNGQIQGINIELAGGCGYSPDLSDAIVDRAMFHSDNAYYFPHAKVTGHRVKTNTVSNTAFRGFGGPQGVIAIESIMDDIARHLNKDPLEVRQRNFYGAEDGRDVTHYGQQIERHIIPDLVTNLVAESEYHKRRQAILAFNANSPYLKKGLAMNPVKFGISFTAQHLNQAGALINIYTDGSILLNHGGTEMGQGLFTKIAQIVAHEMQVDIDNILCSATRTDKVPNTSPTAASSGTDLNGMAALDAITQIKQRFIQFAAEHFQVNSELVRFENNCLIAGEHQMSFAEFTQLAYMHRISMSATGFYRTPKIYYDREKAQGRPFFYFANGAAISEVLIDTLTGEYKLLRTDICQDVGQSLNPALDIGQIEGAFIQGMGWLTTEELVWDKQGRLLTINPASYKIPAIGDTPAQFNVNLLKNSPNVEASIYHSKAVGEPPFMLGISVWLAIRDAVSSLSEYKVSPKLDSPATPERVLKALNQIQKL